ncbi:MAG: PAS domain-containing sensor histidine kinase [Lentilitoribacter sp.]
MGSVNVPSHFASTVPVDAQCAAFLQQMAALMPGIIYVYNHQTMSNEYSNRSIGDLLGYSPEEVLEMGQQLFAKIVHPDDFERLLDHLEVLKNLEDGAQAMWEYRALRRDGTEVWLRSIETVFARSSDGSVLRHIGLAFDITVEKTNELRLEKLNQDLEKRVNARTSELKKLNDDLETRVDARTRELVTINKELEQLSHIATHDLKVPVNNMMSLTNLLGEKTDNFSSQQVETLDLMRNVCVQAANKLDVLASVTQSSTVPIAQFHAVPFAECLEQVLMVDQFDIDRAEIVLNLDFQQPEIIFLREEVENIFQVMLSNAISYRVADRALRIDVSSFSSEDGVTLTITDNGSGIDLTRDLEKVFGLFQRAHVTPTGAGVSLYAIKRILKQIGGDIDVCSQLGTGTTFAIYFPATPKQNGA